MPLSQACTDCNTTSNKQKGESVVPHALVRTREVLCCAMEAHAVMWQLFKALSPKEDRLAMHICSRTGKVTRRCDEGVINLVC